MTAQKPPPSGIGVTIFFIVAFFVGAGIVYVAVRDFMRGSSLRDEAITVNATVSDTRIMTSRKRGDSYEVLYSFEVNGRKYSYTDSTGREDLWAPLEESAWREARSSGTTPVRYMPDDPSNNRAVHHAGEPVFGQIAGGLMGLLCMVPAFLWVIGLVRKKRPA